MIRNKKGKLGVLNIISPQRLEGKWKEIREYKNKNLNLHSNRKKFIIKIAAKWEVLILLQSKSRNSPAYRSEHLKTILSFKKFYLCKR